MANATGYIIRKLEIIIRLIDIETTYIRISLCLAILDHV